MRRLGRANSDPMVVYDELRTIVVKQLGVKPSAVVPEARFVKDLGAD
jgi:acyl carrier protein